jgi:hypothetical protein
MTHRKPNMPKAWSRGAESTEVTSWGVWGGAVSPPSGVGGNAPDAEAFTANLTIGKPLQMGSVGLGLSLKTSENLKKLVFALSHYLICR